MEHCARELNAHLSPCCYGPFNLLSAFTATREHCLGGKNARMRYTGDSLMTDQPRHSVTETYR